jgi:hypothetical protein
VRSRKQVEFAPEPVRQVVDGFGVDGDEVSAAEDAMGADTASSPVEVEPATTGRAGR